MKKFLGKKYTFIALLAICFILSQVIKQDAFNVAFFNAGNPIRDINANGDGFLWLWSGISLLALACAIMLIFEISKFIKAKKKLVVFCWFIVALLFIGLVGRVVTPIPQHESFISNHKVIKIMFVAIIWLIFILVALYYSIRKKALEPSQAPQPIQDEKSSSSQPIISSFILIWSLGFITYCIGTYTEVNHPLDNGFGNFFSVVPMAIIHAFEMFVGQSDISAIHQAQHNNPFYMLFFNVSHMLAILWSLYFIIQQFGFYLIAELKIRFYSYIQQKETNSDLGRSRKNLFIFWGLNMRSFLLATDIKHVLEQSNKESKDSDIVFVRTFDSEDSRSSKMGFSLIFNMIKLKNSESKTLQDLGCFVTTAFNKLRSVSPTETHIIDDALHLNSLARLITNKTYHNVHIFLLGEDQHANVQCAAKLTKDFSLRKFSVEAGKVFIHCHARDNMINRVVEEHNDYESRNIKVRLLDSSKISVNCLRKDEQKHPVSFIKFDSHGKALTSFDAMIIGFGETGRDAFKFLYEYSAFIKTGTNCDRSDYHFDLVDRDMNSIKPAFLKSTPAIVNNPNINFCHYDFNSKEFYDELLTDDKLKKINYVLISLGDDEGGINLAIHLLQYVAKVRNHLNNFHIYVRVFNQSRAADIEATANHYNTIYSSYATGTAQFIVPFGGEKELFTYEIIVKDEFWDVAKAYYEKYNELQAKGNKEYDEGTFDQRHATILGYQEKDGTYYFDEKTHRERPNFKKVEHYSPATIEKIREVKRKESQDLANGYHGLTKRFLINLLCPTFNYLDVDAKLPEEIKTNLAITEHLRWNAAHEMLGYVFAGEESVKCCEKKKQHNCLTSWDNLPNMSRIKGKPDDYYWKYDEIVTETTIAIEREKLLTK